MTWSPLKRISKVFGANLILSGRAEGFGALGDGSANSKMNEERWRAERGIFWSSGFFQSPTLCQTKEWPSQKWSQNSRDFSVQGHRAKHPCSAQLHMGRDSQQSGQYYNASVKISSAGSDGEKSNDAEKARSVQSIFLLRIWKEGRMRCLYHTRRMKYFPVH